MTHRIDAPIRVFLDPSGTAPAAFLWDRRCYRIRRVEACWKQMGPWWDGKGERTCFRVAAEGEPTSRLQTPPPYPPPRNGEGGILPARLEMEGIYELVHDHGSGQWLLAGILD
jgi:hypothetical protein